MIQIIDLTVGSNPAQIRFKWVGDFAYPGIDFDQTEVTAGKRAKKLTGWAQASAAPAAAPGANWHAVDVVLDGAGAATPAFKPTSNDAVELHWFFVGGERKKTDAIVDYPSGVPVTDAIGKFGADLGARVDTLNAHADALNQQAGTLATHGGEISAEAKGANAGLKAAGASIQRDFDLLTGFPFQVASGVGARGGGPAASPASSPAGIVDRELRAVLGRAPGSGGLQATLAALDRSFALVSDDGEHTWKWRPQTYVVQSDIGAGVTGEQASLAGLVSTVGEEIAPLLAGLSPLVPEAKVNPDEIEAAKSIFSSSWPAVTAEVGSDGGPRVARTKRLLTDAARSVQALGCLLGMYATGTTVAGDRYLLDTKSWPVPVADNVVTASDAENQTAFVIVSDRVKLTIDLFHQVYAGAAPLDRGLIVTLLQQALDAAAESAQSVYDALDSVNLGLDERLIILVPNTDGLAVEDIVSWAAGFAIDEAAPLLQDAGNMGAQSIVMRATDLQAAVAALSALTLDPAALPPAITHPRVRNAVDLLTTALQGVIEHAGRLGVKAAVAP